MNENKIAEFEKTNFEKKEGKKNSTRRKRYLETRDLRLMTFCYEQLFLVRSQMIQWLMRKYKLKNFASADIAMRRILKLLKQLELINSSRSGFLDYREMIVINEKGISALKDKGYLPEHAVRAEIDETKINHDFMATEVRLILEKIINCMAYIPDRLLRYHQQPQLPDAQIIYFSPKANREAKIAVEVEMTLKSRERYRKKFIDYQKSQYDLLFYFVNQNSIKGAILEESKAVTQMVFVCSIDELITKQDKAEMVSNDETIVLGDRFHCAANQSGGENNEQ